MVRIGLVGSGFMAQTHLDRYRAMDDARVVAVASPTAAASFVAENGLDATAYTDGEAMMDGDATLDAVDVCSPTPTHRPLVTAAVERGVDVFCEKPLTLTVADAEAVADAVAAADVSLFVGHVLRFFSAYRELAETLSEGAVGEPGTVRARRVSPFPDWADWYADADRSGGVFHDLAIHEFDFCRWVVGDVERVFARVHRGERCQRGHSTLRFANGAVGVVEAGWDRPAGGGLESAFEVAGERGVVAYESDSGVPLRFEGTGGDRDTGDVDLPPPVRRDGYRRELDAFVEMVATGGPPPVPLRDAVEAVRLAVAARRSAARNEPVVVEEVEA
jgi:predicted dehydrogenase